MIEISPEDVWRRFQFDNPWWVAGGKVDRIYREMGERDYLEPFLELVKDETVRRAIVLLGPRRVGKTVMLHQMIDRFLKEGYRGTDILFLSLETPLYTGLSPEVILRRFLDEFERNEDSKPLIVFDEIQYLKEWEVHLKSLVDSFPHCRFVVSGSAAAALRLKSRESGAGRFSDFLLPPLTFAEYLRFTHQEGSLIGDTNGAWPEIRDIEALNTEFVNYLNFGGYPEAVFNVRIRAESMRYVKNDIIDKVLLRDIPQLYGIQDIQELNKLFNTLAYNTGNEISIEDLARTSGVAKSTLRRYLEYLEAAFLIRRVHRIDQNAKRFQRATAFKIYLTNPTMRAALFGNLKETDLAMGALAETAVFSQWFHAGISTDSLFYARWNKGEIDIVGLDLAEQKPIWSVEVKWSDRAKRDHHILRHLQVFQEKHPTLNYCLVTTKTVRQRIKLGNAKIEMVPTSVYAFTLSRNILKRLLHPTGNQQELKL